MTTFDKREEGFEKKFAHEEEQRFKAVARRNRLLGLWAADRVGITGSAADDYAKEVVAAQFGAEGETDLVHKVVGDLGARGVTTTAAEIRVKMDELMALATVQVRGE